jgi:SAM-dependent methyltransferase
MTDQPTAATAPPLPFTGERFTPECVREIWYEHWHRYAFALPLARGREVLDAACGEGYGSALLASQATHVTGVDIDAETIAHASGRYGRPNLSYRAGSVTALDAGDDSFDLVVSFETIEHLEPQARMLDEFRRVLRSDGLLVISSPDRVEYNARAAAANPFHVRELDRDEFLTLLQARFPAVRLYGQRLGFHSVITAAGAPVDSAEEIVFDADRAQGEPSPPASVYHIAVCAADEALLPALPALSLFTDRQASVYNHYNDEIARLIRADHRIMALEKEVAALRAALAGEP